MTIGYVHSYFCPGHLCAVGVVIPTVCTDVSHSLFSSVLPLLSSLHIVMLLFGVEF